MNRRQLLTMGLALPAAVLLPRDDMRFATNNVYGPINIERWTQFKARGIYLHTFLDGRDVTNAIFYCDDIEGIVKGFVQTPNPRGGYLLEMDPETQEARVLGRRGHVLVLPGKDEYPPATL